jgi:hypothetical protein
MREIPHCGFFVANLYRDHYETRSTPAFGIPIHRTLSRGTIRQQGGEEMIYTVPVALVCAGAMSAIVVAALLFALRNSRKQESKPEVISAPSEGQSELAPLASPMNELHRRRNDFFIYSSGPKRQNKEERRIWQLAALIIPIAMIRVTLTPIWRSRADIRTTQVSQQQQVLRRLSHRRENSG